MNLPEYVEVGPYVIPVISDHATIAAERHNYDIGRMVGMYTINPNRILIDPSLDPYRMREVLLHELRHAVWAYASMPGDDEDEQLTQEQVITRETPILLDTLRRNPDVVSFLMDDEC